METKSCPEKQSELSIPHIGRGHSVSECSLCVSVKLWQACSKGHTDQRKHMGIFTIKAWDWTEVRRPCAVFGSKTQWLRNKQKNCPFSAAAQCNHTVFRQQPTLTTTYQRYKVELTPLPPKRWGEMLIFGREIFPKLYYFISEEEKESCLWSAAALGRLFLAQKPSRAESFHQGSTSAV